MVSDRRAHIDTQGVRRNFDRVYPVIILIGITGFITDQILAYLKPKLFPWQADKYEGGLGRLLEFLFAKKNKPSTNS